MVGKFQRNKGLVYALMAALCNSSIGIISCHCSANLNFYQIAFYKSLFAFLITTAFLVSSNCRKQVMHYANKKYQTAILAFFGVFLLYYFETKAFLLAPVAIVSFILYATGILTIILGYFLLNEKITFKKMASLVLVLFGACLIFANFQLVNYSSLIYTIIGGVGYSTFLVFGKKFKVEANIGFLWWLMLFGTIYLAVPAIFQIDHLGMPKTNITNLLLLAIFPTLCGFYFTSKALSLAEAGKVQIVEMSDPLFTTVFGYIFLHQAIDKGDFAGGALIILGLIFASVS